MAGGQGVEGQKMDCRNHQEEGKHQEHLEPDNDSSDQFIVFINLGKDYTPLDALNISFC